MFAGACVVVVYLCRSEGVRESMGLLYLKELVCEYVQILKSYFIDAIGAPNGSCFMLAKAFAMMTSPLQQMREPTCPFVPCCP